MRLDKYLKVSRLIKRRSIANLACDNKKILVGDKPQRASYDVKVGDIIEILIFSTPLKVEVLQTCDSSKKEDALKMYKKL